MDKINGVNYEYQLLRYRHDLATGEFVNVGLVYFDPKTRFLRVRMTERYGRLSDFFGNVSGVFLLRGLRKLEADFKKVTQQLEKELHFTSFSSVEQLTVAVLPPDDNTLFFSPSFKGWHLDHDTSFDELYERLIGRYTDEATEERHDDNYAWKKVFKKYFDEFGITTQLQERQIKTATDNIEFERTVQNGVCHCFQSISFDLKKQSDIRDKIYRWAGIMDELGTADIPLKIYLLSLMPNDMALQRVIEQKLNIQHDKVQVTVVKEQDAPDMIQHIKNALEHHENEMHLL
jgi:hypothetical protein